MKPGDRVVIGKSAWLYGDLGNVTTGLVGTITRGPERRPWGVGANVRMNVDDLNARTGGRIRWVVDRQGGVEMTFNAGGLEIAQ